jgi:uncharacterized protein YbaP (TraB family)
LKYRPLLACLLGLWSMAALADGKHVFWEVTGKHNKVYLLGSVHALKNADRALPDYVEAAYRDAENIVEEVDLFASAGELTGSAVRALQTLPEGQTLAAVLGPALYAHLQEIAAPLQIDPAQFRQIQPWYVALAVTQARITRAGFSTNDGYDYQLAQRAQRDRKPLRGLETAFDQLSIFAAMPMADQCKFLSSTLDETDIADELTELTAVWRSGDLAKIEELLRSGAEEAPEFFKALTTDRNLRWLPQIEAMLAAPKDDYLVVTGALHMVGDMGVVELLRRKGYKVVRK